jgi:hypothetical protein
MYNNVLKLKKFKECWCTFLFENSFETFSGFKCALFQQVYSFINLTFFQEKAALQCQATYLLLTCGLYIFLDMYRCSFINIIYRYILAQYLYGENIWHGKSTHILARFVTLTFFGAVIQKNQTR